MPDEGSRPVRGAPTRGASTRRSAPEVGIAVAAALAFAGFPGSAASSEAGESGAAMALIEIVRSNGGIEILGRALAIVDVEIDASMLVEREGAGGNATRTRQSRALTLSAGETGTIARVGVSHATGDRLSVAVTLTHHGVIVSEAILRAPGGGDAPR